MEDKLPDNRPPMKIGDAMRELQTKPLISLWPTAAAILDVSRSEIYAMAQRGEIEVIPVGRLKKVITAPLRKKLKLESSAAA
jgi:hypothetical protein